MPSSLASYLSDLVPSRKHRDDVNPEDRPYVRLPISGYTLALADGINSFFFFRSIQGLQPDHHLQDDDASGVGDVPLRDDVGCHSSLFPPRPTFTLSFGPCSDVVR
jgi:hypothetical protein